MIRKTFVLCMVSCLIACGSGDVSKRAAKVTENKRGDFEISCSDFSGDSDFSFIDIETFKIQVYGSKIVVELKLLDIPDLLVFNQSTLSSAVLEYGWTVDFDVDGDLSLANNIQFAVTRWNWGEPEQYGVLEDFVQSNLWEVGANGRSASVISDFSLVEANDTLIMTYENIFPSKVLINSSTPFRIFTNYNIDFVGGAVYEDLFPNNSLYITSLNEFGCAYYESVE